jgi:hypothetical protein
MRHHLKNVGIAVLAEQFAGALVVFRGIAVVDTGHFSPWFLRFDAGIMLRATSGINGRE